MTFAVALAMLEREGRWLLQLRDDIEGIVHPGCWGLFGGHLDPGERPEQAILRELGEEIGWGRQNCPSGSSTMTTSSAPPTSAAPSPCPSRSCS